MRNVTHSLGRLRNAFLCVICLICGQVLCASRSGGSPVLPDFGFVTIREIRVSGGINPGDADAHSGECGMEPHMTQTVQKEGFNLRFSA
jgi:hypothetical protein